MTERRVDLLAMSSVPSLIHYRAGSTPAATAWFVKRNARWQGITWQRYQQKIEECAKGLYALGVRKGTALY